MRTYSIEITGKTPLLMHADNVEWADEMDRWKNDPAHKKVSKAGDDRTPPFRWLGSLYHDNHVICLPQDNLMRCLMEGGAMVLVPGGKNGKTFKAQTQSGCVITEAFWPLIVNGSTIKVEPLFEMREHATYDAYQLAAVSHGFQLFLKRAKIGQSKHIRVRPRFDAWEASGTIAVTDDQLTREVLQQILTYAGQYKGLCDWRPGGKTPGSFGMFEAVVK